MLVELSVVEQRYQAVLAVIRDGDLPDITGLVFPDVYLPLTDPAPGT